MAGIHEAGMLELVLWEKEEFFLLRGRKKNSNAGTVCLLAFLFPSLFFLPRKKGMVGNTSEAWQDNLAGDIFTPSFLPH